LRVPDRVEQDARPPEDAPQPDESMEETVRRGRWSGTPFVLLGSVALTIWLVVAIVTGVVLLVWWLV
jgi:hypothetical protein